MRVPETCICLTYGHGLTLTFVVNSQCPFHGPRHDLSPMGGGKRWDDGRYPRGWPRHV